MDSFFRKVFTRLKFTEKLGSTKKKMRKSE